MSNYAADLLRITNAVRKADSRLSDIRTVLRSSECEDSNMLAADILQVILSLRQAME